MEKKIRPLLRLLLLTFLISVQLQAFAGNTRLHITTNKDNYAAAETMQFQVFLLNPSPKINNTLFIELLDCHGAILSKQMLPISANSSSGYIQLPEAGKNAFYLLYCYVRNTDSIESSSIKKIYIGNGGTREKKAGEKIRVSHFFEGGSFVAESPNNILVHCTDENANPVLAKGKITDGKTSVYAVFETNESGFAKVIFNPEANVKYFIEVIGEGNRQESHPLPVAAASGITLNAELTPNSIAYTVISYSAANTSLPDYRVEALFNGEVIYDAAVSFQNGLSAVKEEIKKDSFPGGFIILRVVDNSNKVHARRVIYNDATVAGERFITVIDTVNKKEAKILLPPPVTGKSYVNIQTAAAAADDIKEQDFLTVSEKISINDQLIAAKEIPAIPNTGDQYNRYLSVKGVLTDYAKKPLKNKQVNLVIAQKNLKKQYLVTQTDAEGKLQVNNLVFYDSVQVYYQLAEKSEEKNDVLLDLEVIPAIDQQGGIKAPLNLFCAENIKAVDSSRSIVNADEKTLGQVIINAEKPKTDSEKYSDKYVSGQMKQSQFLRNEIDFIANPQEIDNQPLFAYLQSRIPSIRIFTNSTGSQVITAANGGSVGVYLNDMELPLGESLGFLSNLLVRDVARVKYYSISIKPKQIGGNPLTDARAHDGGDLLIYTKQDYVADERTKGLARAKVVGYSTEKPGLASQVVNEQGSLFWKSDWNVENGQRIYISLPGGAENTAEIKIEGVNSFLLPYRFTQKLVFN